MHGGSVCLGFMTSGECIAITHCPSVHGPLTAKPATEAEKISRSSCINIHKMYPKQEDDEEIHQESTNANMLIRYNSPTEAMFTLRI